MTISSAAVDIIHFGLVFFLTLAIYAASALALFGQEMQEFATFPRSFRSTFLVLLGDFDLPAMEEVGRGLAGFWFWSFQILVVNIMFNMLLAVVIDAYSAVKASTVNAETLWSQSYEIWTRYRGRAAGTRLSFYHILKVLNRNNAKNEAGMYDVITAQDLCKEVEGLPVDQAQLIFTEVAHMLEKENRQEVSLEDAMEKLSKVESRANAIFRGVEIMIDTSSNESSGVSAPVAQPHDQFESIKEMFKVLESKIDALQRAKVFHKL
eukprot:gnl/MRDRNA2_/MRDRNA2_221048_c0_seq1.p1 gnl/MRDRNA2_/MRDRNA2_221048_c0~~gnl/MRDRNA2_/MRDRNA2_221048_c0_seq1.p1  ORF type:complete len:305 (-),score=53.59 gnl/MRDRNA2_/MRDRNA2_221048_c0_seq1:91-885(-)